MSDRGMKKWAPYKALMEQYIELDKLLKQKKEEKPIISEEQAHKVNDVLINYCGQTVEIKWFNDDKINTKKCIIKKIDKINKVLLLDNQQKILFQELVDVNVISIS